MTTLPRWIWAPVGVALFLLMVPIVGMLTRVSWAELPALLTSERALDALQLSLITCVISTVIVVLIGVPTALVLARFNGWWTDLARTAVTMPMVLPPVVAGLALLVTFGRRGLLGQHFSALGIEIGFTTVAVVIAQVFISLPFLIIAVEGALRSSSTDLEKVAATLGASPSRVFWRVTLPVIRPAVASGTALAFARALGEFGATLTFAGSLQGTTRTLPLEIYLLREADSDVALALALVLVVAAIVIVLLSNRLRGGRKDV